MSALSYFSKTITNDFSLFSMFTFQILTRTIAVISLFFLTNLASAQETTCASDAIKALQLGKGFQILSQQLAKATTTYRNLQTSMGKEAEVIVNIELFRSVSKNQDQWDRNLAQAWAPLMTCEEFESLATLKQQSPYAKKFVSLDQKAGAAMQVMSQSLLNTTVSEALARAWTSTQARSKDQ